MKLKPRKYLRYLDNPVGATGAWTLPAICGFFMPTYPWESSISLLLASVIYFSIKLNASKSQPDITPLLTESLHSLINAGTIQCPKYLKCVSIWMPNSNHLRLLASMQGGIPPADGRTRIEKKDKCSIWEAYEVGLAQTEILEGSPTGNSTRSSLVKWDRRECFPIPDIEDRVSVVGVLCVELAGPLTSRQESQLLTLTDSFKGYLSKCLSILIVVPDE